MNDRGEDSTEVMDRRLVILRDLNVPRSFVFKAWTHPEHVARWWGPHGSTNLSCAVDARPGGTFEIRTRRSDGVVVPSRGVFREVVEPEWLAFTSTAFRDEYGSPKLEMLITVKFSGNAGRTNLTLQSVVVKSSPEVAGALGRMEEGWSESLDRLAKYFAVARNAIRERR